ncbi:MAG: extracellular solute-binding protein [Caldilineaceae bacterium]
MLTAFAAQPARRFPTRAAWPQGALLLMTLLLLLLAGCNDQTPTPTAAVTPAPAPAHTDTAAALAPAAGLMPAPTAAPATPIPDVAGTVVLWHSWSGADADALATILLTLQQKYPKLKVDTLFVAYDDLPQSYADAVQAGGGPDLILAPNWWLGEMVAAGVVQPLDDLVPPERLDAFWPATLANLYWQGALYGLPTNFELVTLFYNRVLIEETALPKTTADLLALAQQGPQTGIGLYASLYHLYWGLPAYGAQLFADDGKVLLDQSTGAANFLGWLATLNQVDGAYVDEDYSMLLDRFKKGEFAFLVDGPWSVADLQSALGDQLGVTLLPDGPTAPAQPWLSADGVFMNPTITPEQQRLALVAAEHFTSAESGAALATFAHRLPANRNATVTDPLLQGFIHQAATAQPLPMIAAMDQVWGYGGDMFVRVLDGNEDPTTVVKETTALINDANGK